MLVSNWVTDGGGMKVRGHRVALPLSLPGGYCAPSPLLVQGRTCLLLETLSSNGGLHTPGGQARL